MRWLDTPPAATLAGARDLLLRLGALDADGRITPHGRAMHQLAAHPRLAHMLLMAREHGAPAAAAKLAALLSERDLLRGGMSAGSRERDSDIRSRLDLLRRGGGERGVLERVRRAERAYLRELGAREDGDDTLSTPVCCSRSRIPIASANAEAGDGGRYQLANGRGASFAIPKRSRARSSSSPSSSTTASARRRSSSLRRSRAATCSRTSPMRSSRATKWRGTPRAEAVVARRTVRFGELVLEEKPLQELPPGATGAALLEGLRSLGLDALPWDDDSHTFTARCEFVRALKRGDLGDWPDFSSEALAADVTWLEPYLDGVTRRAHFTRVPLARGAARAADATHNRARSTSSRRRTSLCRPARATPIDYRDDNAPCASMRMQEVFGLAATPRIGGGHVPVTFKLLSPAHRPLQVTRDLASFWKNAYVEVRKDMRGRYPRHYWPENPLEAEPTRRAKPRPRR